MITSLLIFLGYVSPDVKKIKNYNYWKYPYFFYTCMVGILLISPIVLGIVGAVQNWNNENISNHTTISLIIFTVIPFIQYCLGYRYFRESHFTGIMNDCHRNKVNLPKKYLVWGLIAVVVSVLLISKLILFIVTNPPDIYDSYYEKASKIGIMIYIAIYSVYAWTAVSINLTIFFIVFYKHIVDLKKLHKYISETIVWNLDQSTINDLTRKIIGIRYVIRQSIDRLESFYTFATIIGAIAIGPIVQYKVIDPHLVMYIIVYLCMQVMFLGMIYQITYYREEIHKVVKSPAIMSRYLTQIKSLGNIDTIHKSGYTVKEMKDLRLAAFCPITYGDLNDMESGSKLDTQILALEYKMSFGLDWIILHNYLGEPWANFSLMGISFGDTSVIKKSIGLTSIIIIVSNYINSLILV